MKDVATSQSTQMEVLDLGEWLGRRQAYSLVAGTCSAADAKCLTELREAKVYKNLGLTWEEFCRQRVGMSRANADLIIRQYREFGAPYFALRQIAGVTAEEYRGIRGAIENGSLRHAGEAIPIAAEHAPRLLEAVREMRPAAAKTRESAVRKPASSPECEAAEQALREADAAIGKLYERFCIPNGDYQRLLEIAARVYENMRLTHRQ